MQLRDLLGRPRPFRELVVRPRPTATFPSIYAVGALGTVGFLTATLVGMSLLGTVADPSGHLGGRIMAVPYAQGNTSPFLGFGGTPPQTPTRTSGTTSQDLAAGDDFTEGSDPAFVVSVVAARAPTVSGGRYRLTAVSAVLIAPSARGASTPPSVKMLSVPLTKTVATVVSVASAYPLTAAASAAWYATPAVVVVVASPARERAKAASKHAAKHHHANKARHTHDHGDAKPDKTTRST